MFFTRSHLIRIDMRADPMPPPCRMYVSTSSEPCGRPTVLGLKRPDALTIVYVCAEHVEVGERSLI